MALETLTDALPLAPNQYLRCVSCDGIARESVVVEMRGGAQCSHCGEWKGYVRHTHARPGSTFAEKWPGLRKITTVASALILHLDKLGLNHYDLAILAYYEAHNYGGAEQGSKPSAKKAAATLGMSESQVRIRIRQMCKAGYCEKKHRKRDGSPADTTFLLTRLGLTRVAGYIEANVKPDRSVPGLADLLTTLRGAEATEPLAPDAGPPLHPMPPPLADDATQGEAVVGEGQKKGQELLAERDPGDRDLTKTEPDRAEYLHEALGGETAVVGTFLLEFDAHEVTGADARKLWRGAVA